MRGPSRWGGHTLRRLALSLAALAVLLTVPGTVVTTAYGYTNPVDVPYALGFAPTGVASAVTGAVVGILLASGAYADVSLAAREQIDVVIKRTLVHGPLAAGLIGTHLALVLALQARLPVSGGNDLAVAASTLAVAAVVRDTIQPVRVSLWLRPEATR